MTKEIKLAPSWVYSMADYCQMFDLTEEDLKLAILDYPAGISSFNAEMNDRGHKVLSGDQHYKMPLDEMKTFSQQVFEVNKRHLKEHGEILRGDQNIESILADWQQRQERFLQDYEQGKKEHRYQCMTLPRLPFDKQVFDIALCSDHLFHNYVAEEKNQSAIIEELCRVAKEVRIFPLQDEKGKIGENLGHLMLATQQKGCGIEVREVPYHEMKGGNAMLRIWATQCVIESK